MFDLSEKTMKFGPKTDADIFDMKSVASETIEIPCSEEWTQKWFSETTTTAFSAPEKLTYF